MTRLDQMTYLALDIFLEELGTKREANNEEFEAMRKVMEPIQMRIEELEQTQYTCDKSSCQR